MKKEYYVRFYKIRGDEDGYLIILPSFSKLLWWFVREARACVRIAIWAEIIQQRKAACRRG